MLRWLPVVVVLLALLVAGIIVFTRGDGDHTDAERLLLNANRSEGLRSARCKEVKLPPDTPDSGEGTEFTCVVTTRSRIRGECDVLLVRRRLEPGGPQDCMMDRLVTP